MRARHKTSYWDIAIVTLLPAILLCIGVTRFSSLIQISLTFVLVILAEIFTTKFHKIAGSYVDLIGLSIVGFMYHEVIVGSPYLTISFTLVIITRLFTHLFDNELNKKQVFSFTAIVLFTVSQILEFFYIIPWSKSTIPLNPTEEIMWISCTYGVVFTQIFNLANTLQSRRREINKENDSLSVRYNQIIEMYQVLNHNLKTPLANALGKVEIALLTKDTSRLQETKESMTSALEKLNTITVVKKIVAQTNQLNEFLHEWQIAFNHQDIVIDTNSKKA